MLGRNLLPTSCDTMNVDIPGRLPNAAKMGRRLGNVALPYGDRTPSRSINRPGICHGIILQQCSERL